MGAFLFLLEFTIFAKCIRGTDRIIAISQNLTLKTIIYSVFGLVMWLSLTHSATALIVVALLETFAALFYGYFHLQGYALFKNQDNVQSNLVTREGLAGMAINRI